MSLPEIDAWTATIENAVRDVLEPLTQGASALDIDEARAWLMSDDDGAGTFLWVADLLDLTDDMVVRIRARIHDRSPLPKHDA